MAGPVDSQAMFAMLNGRWPGVARPGAVETEVERLVVEAVRAQADAGMDLLTDGLVRWADPVDAVRGALEQGDTGAEGMLVRAWRATAGLPDAAGRTVAAVVPGPCTLAEVAGSLEAAERLAVQLAGELEALSAAGCPLVVIDEPAAIRVGGDGARRTAYVAAHRTLLAGSLPIHAMLAITGGSAWEAGAATILGAPYHSYLFDLVSGPDNWHLVRAAPGGTGIVCAALEAPSREDQAPVLVWAARYAASANGRGLARVGLANASPLDRLAPAEAGRVLEGLARGARLAGLGPDEAIAEGLDPRTFSQGRGRGARRGGLPRT
jgi:hypothetical protein